MDAQNDILILGRMKRGIFKGEGRLITGGGITAYLGLITGGFRLSGFFQNQ